MKIARALQQITIFRRKLLSGEKKFKHFWPAQCLEGQGRASWKQQLNCSCYRAVPGVTRAQEVPAQPLS